MTAWEALAILLFGFCLGRFSVVTHRRGGYQPKSSHVKPIPPQGGTGEIRPRYPNPRETLDTRNRGGW